MSLEVQDYDSHSLDRSTKKLKRQSTRRKNKPVPDPTRSGSMEDITGTQVKEIPDDFFVNFDMMPNMTDQVMDIDIKRNGSTDQFSNSVEGQIVPSRETAIRLSTRSKNNHKQHDFNNTTVETCLDVTLKVAPINTTAGDDTTEGGDTEATDWSSIQVPRYPSSQRYSSDSGYQDQEIDRELATHGNSTENSLTDVTQRDHPSNHLSIKSFDSLKYGTKKVRESMLLLSQLCVVTVMLPADIQQGQKGRGAVLKFRFSPYTQIETLRVAILKVFTVVSTSSKFLWKSL